MTGPEHYREAERLMETAREAETWSRHDWSMAAAQVHATLALTAATVDSYQSGAFPPSDWNDALS